MKQHKGSFDSTSQAAACDRLPDERDSLETRFQQRRCSVIAGTQHNIQWHCKRQTLIKKRSLVSVFPGNSFIVTMELFLPGTLSLGSNFLTSRLEPCFSAVTYRPHTICPDIWRENGECSSEVLLSNLITFGSQISTSLFLHSLVVLNCLLFEAWPLLLKPPSHCWSFSLFRS